MFAADNVSVADPDFVNVPLPDTTPRISPAAAAFTVAPSEPIATVPDNLPFATENFTAPADDSPVPEMINGSAEVNSPPISNVAPLDTVVDERVGPDSPSAAAFVIRMVPAAIDVAPV